MVKRLITFPNGSPRFVIPVFQHVSGGSLAHRDFASLNLLAKNVGSRLFGRTSDGVSQDFWELSRKVEERFIKRSPNYKPQTTNYKLKRPAICRPFLLPPDAALQVGISLRSTCEWDEYSFMEIIFKYLLNHKPAYRQAGDKPETTN